MDLKGRWSVVLFTLAYVLAFSIYYLNIGNYEFIGYILVLLFFFGLIFFTLDRSKFDNVLLWGLSVWGLLHMSGGGLIVNGDVLYNLQIVHLFDLGDTFVLKFDQLVHMYGFFITALVSFELLKHQIGKKPNWTAVYILAALVSMGFGVINEIVEFIATVSLTAVNVGGYYNTALDLVANSIGAFLAIFVMRKRKTA